MRDPFARQLLTEQEKIIEDLTVKVNRMRKEQYVMIGWLNTTTKVFTQDRPRKVEGAVPVYSPRNYSHKDKK